MNKLLATLAGLALAGAASAQVNPARPMVTGHGNVTVQPAKVIVTNQTAATATPDKSDEAVKLDKFVVTGSLMKHPTPKVVRTK